jgi:hypothetical protein
MSSPNHSHMIARQATRCQPVEGITTRPIAERLNAAATNRKAAQDGPCEDCRRAEECSHGLACAAMGVFTEAPRPPCFDL